MPHFKVREADGNLIFVWGREGKVESDMERGECREGRRRRGMDGE